MVVDLWVDGWESCCNTGNTGGKRATLANLLGSHRYGYLPDPYDSRDYVAQDFLRSQKFGFLKRALGYTVGIKPTVGTGGRFDYIADLAAPEDQGQLGSCTAFFERRRAPVPLSPLQPPGA